MSLPITAIFAGLNAILLFYLSFRVVAYRRANRVAFGDQDDKNLVRLMRGQANAAEYMPMSMILLGLSEGMGAPGWTVGLLGGLLFAGRLMHGLYFANPGLLHFRFRVIGMHLTFWPMLLAASGLIGHGALTLLGGA